MLTERTKAAGSLGDGLHVVCTLAVTAALVTHFSSACTMIVTVPGVACTPCARHLLYIISFNQLCNTWDEGLLLLLLLLLLSCSIMSDSLLTHGL